MYKRKKTGSLQSLIEIERAVSKLYRLYSKKFSPYKQFWLDLAEEEIEHANMLIMLKGQIQYSTVSIQKYRFYKPEVEKIFDAIKNAEIFAQQNNITMNLALGTAFDLENSLLENKYYEFYKSDCKAIKDVLKSMKLGLHNHMSKIVNVWNKIRNSKDV